MLPTKRHQKFTGIIIKVCFRKMYDQEIRPNSAFNLIDKI